MASVENPVLGVIKSRRSHRAYRPEQLREEDLQAILEAAIWAPSANNTQAWHFSVVQDQGLLAEIVAAVQEAARAMPDHPFKERALAPGYHTFYHAPTVIFFSGPEAAISAIDTALAVENVTLAAESLGIGSVIIMSHTPAFQGPAGADFTRRLGVPEGFHVIQAVALGYKCGEPAPPARKPGVVTFVR